MHARTVMMCEDDLSCLLLRLNPPKYPLESMPERFPSQTSHITVAIGDIVTFAVYGSK